MTETEKLQYEQEIALLKDRVASYERKIEVHEHQIEVMTQRVYSQEKLLSEVHKIASEAISLEQAVAPVRRYLELILERLRERDALCLNAGVMRWVEQRAAVGGANSGPDGLG